MTTPDAGGRTGMRRLRRLAAPWKVTAGSEIRTDDADQAWIAETCPQGIYAKRHPSASPEHRAHIAVAQAIVAAHNASLA